MKKYVLADPYMARQCPECEEWIFTEDGPFAEGDRTKTLADLDHWDKHHAQSAGTQSPSGALIFEYPFFSYNEKPVQAVIEEKL